MRFLPTGYGISLTRFAGHGTDVWPGLLLHSAEQALPFDADRRPPVPAVDGVTGRAEALGLYRIDDPFAPDLPAAARPWSFRLPSKAAPAMLTGPDAAVAFSRAAVSPQWWSLAVQRGGQCRMLIASAVTFPDDPEDSADALAVAAAASRVHGATIAVKF